jgi:hypothetical protein
MDAIMGIGFRIMIWRETHALENLKLNLLLKIHIVVSIYYMFCIGHLSL